MDRDQVTSGGIIITGEKNIPVIYDSNGGVRWDTLS